MKGGIGDRRQTQETPPRIGARPLDEVEETFYARTLGGDVSCGALVTKILERRCVMLGLHTSQTAVLQIVEEAGPKETSTYRIERAPISRPGRTTIPPLTKCLLKARRTRACSNRECAVTARAINRRTRTGASI
jgi:hypothetical protein